MNIPKHTGLIMTETKKKNLWYYIKNVGQTVGAAAFAFLPEILQLFPEYTLVFKASAVAGAIWKAKNIKEDYLKDNLPNGVAKILDKVPNSITGERGSKNATSELPSGLRKENENNTTKTQ